MTTPGTVKTLGQLSAGPLAEYLRVGIGIPLMGNEMEHLFQCRIKLTTPGFGLGGKLSLSMMKPGLLECIVIKALHGALILGHHKEGIALEHRCQYLRVIRLAVLIVVQVFRHDDCRVPEFSRRCPGSAKEVNAKDINMLGELLAENSILAAGNRLNPEVRRTGNQIRSGEYNKQKKDGPMH